MNLIKSLGLGAYYRVRRISKAFKNWKKFGVIIFGSLFAISNIANLPAMAELDLTTSITPTSATIKVGESTTYFAVVSEGVTNVTGGASINWTVTKSGSFVQAGTGASINLDPTSAGTYNISAAATYNGRNARLLRPATLIVNATTDNKACVITISPTTTSTLNVGATSPTYTAQVKYGTDDVTTTSTIQWVVTKNGQTQTQFSKSGKTFSFQPSAAGSYQINARTNCGDKVAWSNVVNVTVNNPGGTDNQQDLTVSITPTSSTITLGESTTYFAVVSEGVTNRTGLSTFDWTVKRGSVVFQTGQGQSINVRPDQTGTYDITVAARYQNRDARLLRPATLIVNASQDNKACVLTISPTGTKSITLGEDSPLYTAKLMHGTDDITNSATIQWIVTKDGQTQTQFANTGKTFKFHPTQLGTYTINARSNCGDKVAWSNIVILNVNPPANVCVVYLVTPGSANLGLVNGQATQTFTVSAKDQSGNSINLSSINWQLTGNGTINSSASSSVVYNATTAGNASLKVTTAECGTLTVPITVVSSERVLFRVDVTPDMQGPVTCPATVGYNVKAYDQNGQIIDPATEPITFTWTFNSAIGALNKTTGEDVLFTCHTGLTGTFNNVVTATGHYKGMTDDDSAGIKIENLIIQDNLKCPVTVSFSRNPISTNDSTIITASAFTTAGAPITGATFNWQVVNGNGSLGSNTGSSVTFFSGSMVGSAVIRLTTSYAGSQCVQDVIVNINNNDFLRVEISPDPAYAQPNTDVTFTARAWDEFNTEVTGSTTFNWNMLNFSAGTILSTFGNQAVVRTGANFGTFTNAIQVTGHRNGRSDSDEATIIIQQANNFKIDATLVGFAANNNNGVCTDDMITYRLTVTNNQPNTLNGVNAVVGLPVNTTFISATSVTGSPTVSGRQVNWNIGTLGYGQSRVLEVRVMPVNGLRGTQRFVATANVSSIETAASVTSNPVDLNCGGKPVVPGKGPLAPTGIDWRALGLIAIAAFVFASGTYMVIRRREQGF